MVGIEANLTDFPAGVTPVYNLYTSPAFDRGPGRKALGFYGALVRLRHGAADLPRFQVDFQHMAGLSQAHGIQSEDSGITAVERSIHPQAVGWWLFALFVGLVGLGVVGQALRAKASWKPRPIRASRRSGCVRGSSSPSGWHALLGSGWRERRVLWDSLLPCRL